MPFVRLPRGLANEQDLYVIPRSATRDLSGLAGFRRGPWGCVDICRTRGRELELIGWAASLDDGPIGSVSIRVGGRDHTCPITVDREDVPAVFSDPRLRRSGWEFRVRMDNDADFVVVSAASARSEQALLYAGPIRASRDEMV